VPQSRSIKRSRRDQVNGSGWAGSSIPFPSPLILESKAPFHRCCLQSIPFPCVRVFFEPPYSLPCGTNSDKSLSAAGYPIFELFPGRSQSPSARVSSLSVLQAIFLQLGNLAPRSQHLFERRRVVGAPMAYFSWISGTSISPVGNNRNRAVSARPDARSSS